MRQPDPAHGSRAEPILKHSGLPAGSELIVWPKTRSARRFKAETHLATVIFSNEHGALADTACGIGFMITAEKESWGMAATKPKRRYISCRRCLNTRSARRLE